MKKILSLVAVLVMTIVMAGCSQADNASQNLHREAEAFNIMRRIIATNGITDSLLLEVVGYCSIETAGSHAAGTFEITCKNGDDAFSKDFIWLSDNVMITLEQLDDIDVPEFHRIMRFNPQGIMPVIDFVGGGFGE